MRRLWGRVRVTVGKTFFNHLTVRHRPKPPDFKHTEASFKVRLKTVINMVDVDIIISDFTVLTLCLFLSGGAECNQLYTPRLTLCYNGPT